MSWFDLFTFEKLYLLKKGPIFVGSYAIQNKLSQKSICSHQLFRQKGAFPRLSTSVLHKRGHTSMESSPIFTKLICWRIRKKLDSNHYLCLFEVFLFSIFSLLHSEPNWFWGSKNCWWLWIGLIDVFLNTFNHSRLEKAIEIVWRS